MESSKLSRVTSIPERREVCLTGMTRGCTKDSIFSVASKVESSPAVKSSAWPLPEH